MNDYSFRLETSAGRLYAFVVAESEDVAEGRLDDWIEQYCSDPNFEYRYITLKQLPTRLGVNDPRVLALWDRGPDSIGKSWWYALGRGPDYEQFYQATFGKLASPDDRSDLSRRAREAGQDVFEYISEKEHEAWQRP